VNKNVLKMTKAPSNVFIKDSSLMVHGISLNLMRHAFSTRRTVQAVSVATKSWCRSFAVTVGFFCLLRNLVAAVDSFFLAHESGKKKACYAIPAKRDRKRD